MPETAPVSHRVPPVALIAAALFGALFLATLVLWAHYGTAVFYETLVTGLAACL